jgi:hypothetical protein
VNNRTTERGALFALLMLAGMSVHADDDCDVPTASWQPRGAVEALAQRNGWQIDHLKVDDGCYEIKGRDSEGFRFKVRLNPASLDVVDVKRERERRQRPNEAPDRKTQDPNQQNPGED